MIREPRAKCHRLLPPSLAPTTVHKVLFCSCGVVVQIPQLLLRIHLEEKIGAEEVGAATEPERAAIYKCASLCELWPVPDEKIIRPCSLSLVLFAGVHRAVSVCSRVETRGWTPAQVAFLGHKALLMKPTQLPPISLVCLDPWSE